MYDEVRVLWLGVSIRRVLKRQRMPDTSECSYIESVRYPEEYTEIMNSRRHTSFEKW